MVFEARYYLDVHKLFGIGFERTGALMTETVFFAKHRFKLLFKRTVIGKGFLNNLFFSLFLDLNCLFYFNQ